MKTIVFTGLPWSGKSEAVAVAQKMGFPVIRMGDLVWAEVRQRGLSITPDAVGKVASEMRIQQGADIWAKRTVDVIRKMEPQSLVVIDGARSLDEINYFKGVFKDNFLVVAVVSSDTIRHQRALSRKRKDDSTDIAVIKERDEREKSWGVEKVIQSADVVYDNNDGLEMFHSKIHELLDDLQKR